MEDIVAVEVRLRTGENRFFLTWGRIQDPVDPAPLAAIVLEVSTRFAIGGEPASARVLWSLRAARDAPDFYEHLFHMAQRPIPYGDGYESWRAKIDGAQRQGREIWYVGYDVVPVQPDEPDAVVKAPGVGDH